MWTKKRTAGTQLGWAGPPAVLFYVLLVALITAGGARGEDGKPSLRAQLGVRGALEIEFSAEHGMVYTVEAQLGSGDWVPIYGPVYGEDRTISDFVTVEQRYLAYRLQTGEIRDLGDAPGDIRGHSYTLNRGEAVSYLFATPREGVRKDRHGTQRGFIYSYLKTTPDRGRVTLEYIGGGAEVIEMHFLGARVGTCDSTMSRPGRRDRREAGTFRAGDHVDADDAAPPATVEGSHFIFRDRALTMSVEFTSDASGILSRQGGDSEVISYTYDVTPWREAVLVISATTGERHEYAMSFGARNSGMFVRHVIDDGERRDTDRGKFSGKKGEEEATDEGRGGGNTEPECPAPDKLEGMTLTASFNGTSVTIILNGTGSGSVFQRRANGRVSFKPFTYTYSKESDTEGRLTIAFPTGNGSDTEVYGLSFQTQASGTCVRERYEGDERDGADNGDFTISAIQGGSR